MQMQLAASYDRYMLCVCCGNCVCFSDTTTQSSWLGLSQFVVATSGSYKLTRTSTASNGTQFDPSNVHVSGASRLDCKRVRARACVSFLKSMR